MSATARASLVSFALAWITGALLAVASPAAALTDYPVPTQDSGPADVTLGPDGALWFAETKANKVGRLTTAGAFEELPLLPQEFKADYIADLITGTDGNLWLRMGSGTILGRLNPTSRAIDYYDVPQFGAFAGAPNGFLWFAGIGDNGGIYATNGPLIATVLPPESPDSKCSALTAGPGNTMWCGYETEIRRFDLATETIKAFGLGGDSVEDAYELTVGPDGAIWYTRYLAGTVGAPGCCGSIGRLRPDGSVKEWEMPEHTSSASIPQDLKPGPDGALWFLLDGGFGRITTDGELSTAQIPGRSIDSFAFGPDGAIWYTDYPANRITRVTIAELFPGGGPGTAGRPKIRSKSLRYRKGKIKVKLSCPAGGECAGKLLIRQRKLKLAKGSYKLAAGKTGNATAKPTKMGRALLQRARKSLKVTVELRPAGGGEKVTEKLKLRG